MNRHRLAHLIGMNHGEVESVFIKGDVWVGFRCHFCNEIDGLHRCPEYLQKKTAGSEPAVELDSSAQSAEVANFNTGNDDEINRLLAALSVIADGDCPTCGCDKFARMTLIDNAAIVRKSQ